MAVATSDALGAFAKLELLVAEYKATLACCREAIERLEDVERRLHDAAGALGISTDSLDLPNDAGTFVPEKGTATPVTLLSEREMLVFTLIGQGATTPQIAEQLAVAVSTVETYRERVKHKLDLATGAALAREAVLWSAANAMGGDNA